MLLNFSNITNYRVENTKPLMKKGKMAFTLMPSLHLIIVRSTDNSQWTDNVFNVYEMTFINPVQEVRDTKFSGLLGIEY